jgi:hypothetical protein
MFVTLTLIVIRSGTLQGTKSRCSKVIDCLIDLVFYFLIDFLIDLMIDFLIDF